MKLPFFRQMVWCMVFTMFILGIAPRVEAGMAPSEAINSAINRTQDMDNVQRVIESKMVRERLEKLGFTADEVKSRLERLSDQQLHELAQNLDDIKVAGDGLGIVIAILVIAILVVLLLQLTGHKVIVK